MIKSKPKPSIFDEMLTGDEIEPREIEWLWYPYIPIGMATMLYGRGGIGKSHIMVDIAARITRGDPMPGTTLRRPPGNVMILNSEDDYSSVLRPRLDRAGADVSRVYFLKDEFAVLSPEEIRRMTDVLTRMAITFVVIDPVASFMGGKIDMNRMNEVRSWTGPLHHAAKQSQSAIVIVHHTKKGTDNADYDRAAGSVDFTNAMRSTLYVEKMNDGTRVMRNPKNNNAKEGMSMPFSFDDGIFEWGEPFEEGDIVVLKGGFRTAAAQNFLRAYLAAGPVPAVTLIAAALDGGIPKATLDRAKAGVAESYAKRTGTMTTWYWRLKGDKREPTLIPSVDDGRGNTPSDVGGEDNRRDPLTGAIIDAFGGLGDKVEGPKPKRQPTPAPTKNDFEPKVTKKRAKNEVEVPETDWKALGIDISAIRKGREG